MKIKILVVAMLCSVMMASAQTASSQKEKKEPTKKLIESIVGKWQLTNVIDKNKKTEASKDTLGISWIDFRPDGKYKSGSNGTNGSVQVIDSGSYRLNEQIGVLYLQSAQNDGQVSHPPVEWSLVFDKGNAMTLAGRGSAHAQRYKYVYTKTKEGLGTNP